MTRTYEQMVDTAIEQCRELINEGGDVERAEFVCTPEERLVLNMAQLPDKWGAQSIDRQTLCGIAVVVEQPPVRTIEVEVDGMKRVLRLNLETTYLEIPLHGVFENSGKRNAEGHEIWVRRRDA